MGLSTSRAAYIAVVSGFTIIEVSVLRLCAGLLNDSDLRCLAGMVAVKQPSLARPKMGTSVRCVTCILNFRLWLRACKQCDEQGQVVLLAWSNRRVAGSQSLCMMIISLHVH